MINTISVICPVFFSFRGKELFVRAERVLQLFLDTRTEVIFVLGQTGSRFDDAFAATVTCKGARLICRNYADTVPSPGELRHIGAQYAHNAYLLFWDIDLVATADLLVRIERHPFFTTYGFIVIPCLYMNSTFLGELPVEKLPDDLSVLFFDKILYVALNTSTIFISKKLYHRSGGFKKIFIGHGFEDFDLLCNLIQNICCITISDRDFLSYKKTFSPLFYTDFRRHLNKITLPVFLDNIYSLHVFHPIIKKFIQNRDSNYINFINDNIKHTNNNYESNNSIIIDNINFFLNEIKKRNIKIKHYSFLFNSIDHNKFIKYKYTTYIKKKIYRFISLVFKFCVHSVAAWQNRKRI